MTEMILWATPVTALSFRNWIELQPFGLLIAKLHCNNKLNFDWWYTQIFEQVSKLNVYYRQGLSQGAPLRQSRTAIGIVPLKNGQGDNSSPSKFREKTRKEAHMKRFISVQKLQAETERGKYILSHL